jgi:2-haloacid dehalogenase
LRVQRYAVERINMERKAPRILTFDIFGTVLDWRAGLLATLNAGGIHISASAFDEIVDAQGEDEALGPNGFRLYSEITARSLKRVLNAPDSVAIAIGHNVGRWPPFSDSREGLRRLLKHCLCVAMTNSDRLHGEQAQEQLGFRLSHWFCAEAARVYKPSPEFWLHVSQQLHLPLNSEWWHVSAYSDYDHATAHSLGLTTVFVDRPHSRRSPTDIHVRDLLELAEIVENLNSRA